MSSSALVMTQCCCCWGWHSNLPVVISLLYFSDSDADFCICYVFFSFFTNLCNRLLTLGIAIYRVTLVLGSSYIFSSYQKKVMENIILLAIILTSLNLTGWAVYYREDYRHFLGQVKIKFSVFFLTFFPFCSGRNHEFFYNFPDFYQMKTFGGSLWSLSIANPFHIATLISFCSSMVVTPVCYAAIYR